MIGSSIFILWQFCILYILSLYLSIIIIPKNTSYNFKNKNLSSSKREYSTSSKDLPNLDGIGNTEPIVFESLEEACGKIKSKYQGVSGVYKLTNKNNKSRFYIGSSANLARRMDEYYSITKNLRTPHSASEIEIYKTSASDWSLEFIYITSPSLSLVYEQYAIVKFNSTINVYRKVTPRVDSQWGNNLDHAIFVTERLLSYFDKYSEGFIRLSIFLQVFKTANKFKYEEEDIGNKFSSFLVFVYDIKTKNTNPIVYSSINKALKALQISHSSLLNHVNNNYLFNSQFIIAFEPINEDEFKNYSLKPAGDNQLRKQVTVYNQINEVVIVFKSGREMARYYNIDLKVARAGITKGEFRDFWLIVNEIPFRKSIYVFDSNTLELITQLDSTSNAMKYAKISFYTLKKLIENGNSYQGKIYSYKDKI